MARNAWTKADEKVIRDHIRQYQKTDNITTAFDIAAGVLNRSSSAVSSHYYNVMLPAKNGKKAPKAKATKAPKKRAGTIETNGKIKLIYTMYESLTNKDKYKVLNRLINL
jgi:hypothetical protein